MERKSAKIGEANQGNFFVLDDSGQSRMPNEAIVPVLHQFEDERWKLVGTGFFLTGNGLVATARHVLEDFFDQYGRPRGRTEIIQFQPDGSEYFRRRLVRCSLHQQADVAVGVAEQLKFLSNVKPLLNPSITLSARELAVGENVFTYAYPNTVHTLDQPQRIYVNPRYYAGTISEYFPDGRDSVLLPSSCYQTSMAIHGGASGGPVFDSNGNAVGINSTGYEGCPDVSFISCISDLLALDMALNDTKESKRVELRDIAARGFIRVE